MISSINLNFPLLIYCLFACISLTTGKIYVTEDKPYDAINIKIPQVVWKKALRPTPVLKAPVTVVVPVNVPDEEYIEADEDVQDEVTETNPVESVSVLNEEVISVVANDTTVADVTENPVQSEGNVTEVPGQVFRFPCRCLSGQCGCCTGAILDRFNTKACGNISFIPEEFMFDVTMSLNNRTVVRRRVSASDPPPICFNPRRAPFVQICAELSNIRVRNRNAYACLDIEADIGGFPVYSASFRCFGFGQSGIQTNLKPKKPKPSKGPKPVSLYGNSNDDDDEDGFSIFGGGDDDDDDGPLGGLGDVVGDLFDGRQIN